MAGNMKAESVFINEQYSASIAAHLMMVRVGCATGWLSLSIPLLQSNSTPLETGKISLSDMSWMGSVVGPGAVMGNYLFDYIISIMGIRNTMFLVCIPQLISYLLLRFGTCPLHLVISRFVNGMANGGAQTCVFLFVAEIANNEVRGKLRTIFRHAQYIAISIAFFAGSYFDFVTSSLYFIGITVTFLVAISFVPSTPQYFQQKNMNESAEKASKFYYKHQQYTDQFESGLSLAKANESESEPESKLTWRDIIKSRHGLLRVIIFSLLNRLTAHSIFLTYGSAIIPNAGSTISPELSSIFMSAVQLASTFVTYKLIGSKGRKFILILSLVGCAMSHAVMIAYLQLNGHAIEGSAFQSSMAFHLIPLICMSIVIFVASIGIVPLTFICIAESFPNKSRPFGMVFGNIAFNSLAFSINKMYPLMEEKIGLKACLIVFCVACTFGIIYVGFLVNDTNEEKRTDEMDDSDETDEFDEADETILRLQMRREMRRMSRSYRLSQYRIQPRDVRKYSVVSFA